MTIFWRDFLGHLRSPLTLAIWFGLSFLAALTGPFGTFLVMDGVTRAAYWFGVIGASILIAVGVRALAMQIFGKEQRVMRDAAVIAGNMLFFAPALIAFNRAIFPDAAPPLMNLRVMLVYVFLISLAVTVMRRMHENRAFRQDEEGSAGPAFQVEEAAAEPAAPVASARPAAPAIAPAAPRVLPRLADRLPEGADLGGIVRLTVEDHVVNVVGVKGRERLRMRFADAIKEMEPINGHCTHRSHWVVADAIEEVCRSEGKIFLRMSNGDNVPVSRKYRPNLEALGIL